MADEVPDHSRGLAATNILVCESNESVREASITSIALIEICNKLFIAIMQYFQWHTHLTLLYFLFNLESCESVVLYIILLLVVSEFSRLCKMVHTSKAVGPRCYRKCLFKIFVFWNCFSNKYAFHVHVNAQALSRDVIVIYLFTRLL